jgi:heme/copper-type cytochrome/quinol oxidase subunit 3
MEYIRDVQGAISVEYGAEERLGIWIFIISEIVFFSALIVAYVYLRLTSVQWPSSLPELPVGVAFLNTIFLLSSSGTFHYCYASLRRGQYIIFKLNLFLTLVLGVIFLSIQAYEWRHLLQEGLSPKANLFGTAFFTLTGFHGAHVSVGVLILFWVFIRALRNYYTSERYLGIEMIGIYWHFVDSIWVVLFLILYIW